MEFVNQVTLEGRVGRVKIIGAVGAEWEVAYFLVAHQKDWYRSGETYTETQWFPVESCEGDGRDLSALKEGAVIRVKGELRSQTHIGLNGERTYVTIIAKRFEVAEEKTEKRWARQ